MAPGALQTSSTPGAPEHAETSTAEASADTPMAEAEAAAQVCTLTGNDTAVGSVGVPPELCGTGVRRREIDNTGL